MEMGVPGGGTKEEEAVELLLVLPAVLVELLVDATAAAMGPLLLLLLVLAVLLGKVGAPAPPPAGPTAGADMMLLWFWLLFGVNCQSIDWNRVQSFHWKTVPIIQRDRESTVCFVLFTLVWSVTIGAECRLYGKKDHQKQNQER